MSESGSDVIIKGTSVTIEFDDTLYKKQGDPKKFKNDNRKITQIEVVDDSGTERFKASDNGGMRWTIKVTTK